MRSLCALSALIAALPTLAQADPTITFQPESGVACPGGKVFFNVQATGTGQLGYQWQLEATSPPRQWIDIQPVEAPGDMRTHYLFILQENGSSLRIALASKADVTRYRCIVSDSTGSTVSNPVSLAVLEADVGMQGGQPGSDGVMDNNDFIVFIDGFFQGETWADLGMQGGMAGPDGTFDANDFIVYIDLFFNGCMELHEPSPPPHTPLLPDPGIDP